MYEAAPKILDLRRYNGTLTDTNRTDADVLRYLRLLTRSARLYGADTLPTLSAYNARLAATATAVGAATIPISMQYTRFASIRPEALQNNWLRAQNEQLFDVAGRTQSPYQGNVLFAAAPTISRARTNAVRFVLRRNLYLTSTGAVPTNLYLDFGNGQGYQAVAWNVPVSTSYATAGMKRVKVKIVFSSQPQPVGTGRIVQAAAPQPVDEVRESWFDFNVWSVAAAGKGTATANCAICDAELPVAPANTSGAEHSGGTAFAPASTFGNPCA